MGSLMAGWDSPVHNPNLVRYRRNKSLTKEEIEAYWKSKKQKEEEHLRDISLLSPRTHQKMIFEEAAKGSEATSSTEALPKIQEELLDMDNERSLEKIIQKNGWWTSSKWAFLNEPPVITPEGSGQRYAAQFHVSGGSNGQTGISA